MKNRYIGVRFAELKDQRSEAWRGGAVRFGVSAGGAEVALGDGGFGRGSAFLVEYPRGKKSRRALWSCHRVQLWRGVEPISMLYCAGSSGGSDLFEANSSNVIGGLFPDRWPGPSEFGSYLASARPADVFPCTPNRSRILRAQPHPNYQLPQWGLCGVPRSKAWPSAGM